VILPVVETERTSHARVGTPFGIYPKSERASARRHPQTTRGQIQIHTTDLNASSDVQAIVEPPFGTSRILPPCRLCCTRSKHLRRRRKLRISLLSYIGVRRGHSLGLLFPKCFPELPTPDHTRSPEIVDSLSELLSIFGSNLTSLDSERPTRQMRSAFSKRRRANS
jgi:hypothetical protein